MHTSIHTHTRARERTRKHTHAPHVLDCIHIQRNTSSFHGANEVGMRGESYVISEHGVGPRVEREWERQHEQDCTHCLQHHTPLHYTPSWATRNTLHYAIISLALSHGHTQASACSRVVNLCTHTTRGRGAGPSRRSQSMWRSGRRTIRCRLFRKDLQSSSRVFRQTVSTPALLLPSPPRIEANCLLPQCSTLSIPLRPHERNGPL